MLPVPTPVMFTFGNPLFVAGLAIAGAIIIGAILAATQPPQQK